MPRESEVMWAAGFWEGEGCVGPRAACASQVDLWPLERLVAAFGGRISLDRKATRRPNERPCHQWWVCGEQGRAFVAAIYPHLSPRRKAQIDKTFITEEKRQRNRGSLYKIGEQTCQPAA